MLRLFQHSVSEKEATRGGAMEMVRICSTWDILLGLSLKKPRGGARIKLYHL